MFMHQSQSKKRLAQVGVALLTVGLLLTSFGRVSKAHAASSVLTLNVQPYMYPYTVYEVGVAQNQVIATGTDALGPGDPLTVTIDWGDNTAPTQQMFIDGRTFQVSGAHAYSQLGTYTVTVTVAISVFQQSITGTGTITVVPQYTLNVQNIHPDAGQVWSGTVALGTDPFPNDPLNVTIDWGDNTATTNLQVTSSASGTFQVNSTHTYSYAAGWTITVTATSYIVGPITATGMVAVGAGVTITIPPINAVAGQAWSGLVASGTDIIPNDSLQVSIDWGDGTTPTSQYVSVSASGTYQVNATHIYTAVGTYPITVSILSIIAGFAANPQTGTATVVAPAFTITTRNITCRAGRKCSRTLATVTGTISKQGLSAIVTWGDGTSSTLQLAKGGVGTFHINGNHTYSTAGTYLLTITVQDNGTHQMATGTGQATVLA